MKANLFATCFYGLLLILLLANCRRNRDEPVNPNTGPGFTVNDFSKSSIITIRKNSEVKGSAMKMAYSEDQPEAEIGTTEHFAIAKGFESTFTFAGQPGNYLQIRLFAQDESIYNPYGISTIIDNTVFNIGNPVSKTVTSKLLPSLFDGKRHTVKIQIQNLTDTGLVTTIFIDDMNQAAFMGEDTTLFSRQKLYGPGPRANRRVSLLFFGNGPRTGEATIYNWSFKPL